MEKKTVKGKYDIPILCMKYKWQYLKIYSLIYIFENEISTFEREMRVSLYEMNSIYVILETHHNKLGLKL